MMKQQTNVDLTPSQVAAIRECVRNEEAYERIVSLITDIISSSLSKKNNKNSIIYVIDDDVEVIKVVQGILCMEGYQVIACSKPLLALSLMEKDIPNLVFLDVEMPEMDGGELLGAMRANPRLQKVPVVFTTGLVKEKEEPKVYLKGSPEFIAKPYTKEKLLKAINKHLKY